MVIMYVRDSLVGVVLTERSHVACLGCLVRTCRKQDVTQI